MHHSEDTTIKRILSTYRSMIAIKIKKNVNVYDYIENNFEITSLSDLQEIEDFDFNGMSTRTRKDIIYFESQGYVFLAGFGLPFYAYVDHSGQWAQAPIVHGRPDMPKEISIDLVNQEKFITELSRFGEAFGLGVSYNSEFYWVRALKGQLVRIFGAINQSHLDDGYEKPFLSYGKITAIEKNFENLAIPEINMNNPLNNVYLQSENVEAVAESWLSPFKNGISSPMKIKQITFSENMLSCKKPKSNFFSRLFNKKL